MPRSETEQSCAPSPGCEGSRRACGLAGWLAGNGRCALLLGDGHGQPHPSLAAAAGQRLATARGLHALAETMRAQAALVMGLVGTLHGRLLWDPAKRVPFRSVFRRPCQAPRPAENTLAAAPACANF